MKKMLLTLCISACAVFYASADGFTIQNYLGVNCLVHDISSNESFYQVARRYFVRPSTLAVVNNIEDVENIPSGKRLFIPLTETNFYTTKGLESSKFSFKPVYYKVISEKKLSDVASSFYINPTNLSKWNSQEINSSLDQGDRLIVGWVKYEKDLKASASPDYIRKEKIVFGNSAEKIEAREYLLNKNKKKEIQKVVSTPIKQTTKPIDKQRKIVAKKQAVKKVVPRKIVTKEKEELVAKKEAIKVPQKKVPKTKDVTANKESKKALKKKISKQQPITKKEKEYLKTAKPKKEKSNKPSVFSKVKKWTKNSYVRKKQKNEVKSKAPKQKKVVKKKIDKTPATKSKVKKETVVANVPTPTKIVVKEESKKEIEQIEEERVNDKPLYLENKLQRLTLLKSIKGRASFFYSGNAGAKFYTFTNLAGKGGVIKITNLNNGRYILAEVVGPLPETDRKRGYLLKLSNNSKLILGANTKSFSAKVNY